MKPRHEVANNDWLFSARPTYLDPILNAIRKEENLVPAYCFYDLNGKIRFTGPGSELSAVTHAPPRSAVREWVVLDTATLEFRTRLQTFETAGSGIHHPVTGNALEYGEGLLEARFDRVDVPAFQIGPLSLESDSDFVIDPDRFEQDDFDALQRISSSPPIEALSGTIRLPWFAVYLEGRYKAKIFALDQKRHDLIRSAGEP